MILYHGTSAENARSIAREGFVCDRKYNWRIKSKPGYVYLSSAYAPFYAMNAKGSGDTFALALIKAEVRSVDLYPEDDFLMCALKKQQAPAYTQEELDAVDLEKHKHLWQNSLKYMGNAAAKPDRVKVLGVREFSGKQLLMVCDPVVSPLNFRIMGEYYKALTRWIYAGKDPLHFNRAIH